ncbi:MAG: YqeG family HAD IIIA-type phosphatase [Oscillospiraceae bacterium]|nr:YqeG family HAD IIIA-type phosphatase [Oscillospiraceae bacterium]
MLKKFYPSYYAKSVFSINYDKLYEKGFRGIVFDIDNTLVHHGDDSNERVDGLFRRIHEKGFKTVLLTDNTEERVKRFIKNIDTAYVCEAEKPDPAGFRKALEIMKLTPDRAVVIGDQIFTDILGANKAGIKSILVKFIRLPEEKRIGKRRYLEKLILSFDKSSSRPKKRRLFCEINPFCYMLSEKKGIMQRHIKDILSRESFAGTIVSAKLPNVVSAQSCGLIKRGKDIDIRLQENKAENIRIACRRLNGLVIRPGEVFSFWRTVGRITKGKGYKDGRTLVNGKLVPGIGGGLCNLGNLINLLVLDSPLEVTEFHTHSDALAPDNGKRIPLSSGTSVGYNYVDYRFKNNTDQNVQLLLWCDEDKLYGELRSEMEFPWRFELVEEDHRFSEENGKYYRISRIYKVTTDRATGVVIEKRLILDNHSEVMFSYDLIPKDQIMV